MALNKLVGGQLKNFSCHAYDNGTVRADGTGKSEDGTTFRVDETVSFTDWPADEIEIIKNFMSLMGSKIIGFEEGDFDAVKIEIEKDIDTITAKLEPIAIEK